MFAWLYCGVINLPFDERIQGQIGTDNFLFNITLIRQSEVESDSESLVAVSTEAFKWKDYKQREKGNSVRAKGGVPTAAA